MTTSASVGLQRHLLLRLIDRKPHRLGEFLEELLVHVDPTFALREYQRRWRGSNPIPLERMVRLGAENLLLNAIRSLAGQGRITRDNLPDRVTMADGVLQLTERGVQGLTCTRARQKFFAEVARLWGAGKLDIVHRNGESHEQAG